MGSGHRRLEVGRIEALERLAVEGQLPGSEIFLHRGAPF
jgi:hypothetical protein